MTAIAIRNVEAVVCLPREDTPNVTPNVDPYDAHDPLAGVILHDRPCPPGKNPEQAIREQDEVAGIEPAPYSDEELMLLRMLRNCVEDADARTAELGVHGGEKGYWEGKAEATELASRGWSMDLIADFVGVRPQRIARLFTNDVDRLDPLLAVDRLVRSGDWDGMIDSVQAVAPEIPRPTLKQMLIRMGVSTKAADQYRRGGGYKYSPEQYESIRKMRQDFGWSYANIGKHVGIDPATCFRICQRKGWS